MITKYVSISFIYGIYPLSDTNQPKKRTIKMEKEKKKKVMEVKERTAKKRKRERENHRGRNKKQMEQVIQLRYLATGFPLSTQNILTYI